jgi:hypothetical protein
MGCGACCSASLPWESFAQKTPQDMRSLPSMQLQAQLAYIAPPTCLTERGFLTCYILTKDYQGATLPSYIPNGDAVRGRYAGTLFPYERVLMLSVHRGAPPFD